MSENYEKIKYSIVWNSPEFLIGPHMSYRWLERTVTLDYGVPLDGFGQIAIHVVLCDHVDARVDDPRQRNTQ